MDKDRTGIQWVKVGWGPQQACACARYKLEHAAALNPAAPDPAAPDPAAQALL